jgi:toxin HigB-1
VIKSFADKAAAQLFAGQRPRRLPPAIHHRARRLLIYIHAAVALRDLAQRRSARLEALKGDRKGQHSMRINNQWRICFTWRDGHAYDVEIVDYHR